MGSTQPRRPVLGLSPIALPTRRDVLRLGGAFGLMAMVPACRSEGADTQDSATGSNGQPRRGGTLTIAQGLEAHPAGAFKQALHNQVWRRAVLDTLVEYQPDGPTVAPGLAESWEQSDDGRQLTLRLREGVQWHSGRPFDPEDVRFSIEMAVDGGPSVSFAWALGGIQGLEVDGMAVTMTFAEPVSALFDVLTLMPIIDRESFDGFMDGTEVIGTGPFTLASFNPSTGMQLVRNESYWRDGRPYLDGIDLRFITRSEALVAAVQSGDVDLGVNLLPLDRQTVEQDERFDVVAYDTFGAGLCAGVNVNVEPLNIKEVRQAIHFAIDRQRLNDELYLGQGEVSVAPWSPVSPAYDPSYADAYARDLDRARSLLAAAGADGAEIIVEGGTEVNKACEIVAFNLEEIGLSPKVEILEAAVNSDRFGNNAYRGLRLGFHGSNTLEPITLIRVTRPYAAENNLFNFDSDEYRALADALASSTADTVADASTAISDFLIEEAFCLDLVHTTNNAVSQGTLHDWSYTSWDEILWADAWKS